MGVNLVQACRVTVEIWLTGMFGASILAVGSRLSGIHYTEQGKDELMADWELAINGEQIFNIDPLR